MHRIINNTYSIWLLRWCDQVSVCVYRSTQQTANYDKFPNNNRQPERGKKKNSVSLESLFSAFLNLFLIYTKIEECRHHRRRRSRRHRHWFRICDVIDWRVGKKGINISRPGAL